MTSENQELHTVKHRNLLEFTHHQHLHVSGKNEIVLTQKQTIAKGQGKVIKGMFTLYSIRRQRIGLIYHIYSAIHLCIVDVGYRSLHAHNNTPDPCPFYI